MNTSDSKKAESINVT